MLDILKAGWWLIPIVAGLVFVAWLDNRKY